MRWITVLTELKHVLALNSCCSVARRVIFRKSLIYGFRPNREGKPKEKNPYLSLIDFFFKSIPKKRNRSIKSFSQFHSTQWAMNSKLKSIRVLFVQNIFFFNRKFEHSTVSVVFYCWSPISSHNNIPRQIYFSQICVYRIDCLFWTL